MNHRWTAVTESGFQWEQEALNYIREQLPDQEPFRAWANFEFMAEDGSINEVDLLVISLYKIFLVEIKSWAGRITGDAGTWTRENRGHQTSLDNPLLLTNRKAKKLKSLLARQPAFNKQGVPYVEPIIFLSSPAVRCDLTGPARVGVYLRPDQTPKGEPHILGILTGTSKPALSPPDMMAERLKSSVSAALARAMDQAGIRRSQRAYRVGEYRIEQLLHENDVYQDWQASHTSLPKAAKKRVRIYPAARQDSALSREERRQAAEREYQILEGISHAGILKVETFCEHERGYAVVFEHDSGAKRLDWFLHDQSANLDVGARLDLVRQIAETLRYGHERRLYHRALSPQTILVTAPDQPHRQIKIFDWQTARRKSAATDTAHMTTDDPLHLSLFGDPQSLCYMAPEAFTMMTQPQLDAQRLDIFALGAIAYHVFSGLPPASTIDELRHKCEAGPGLYISDVMDGAGERLHELIQISTMPAVVDRWETVRDFLNELHKVEDELTAPEPEATVHPLDARAHDRLAGGFEVKKRLGQGSTCVALLVVRDDGREGVLKVALRPELNPRLTAEGQTLQHLRHQNIVALYDQVEINGHAALFMALAGTENKAGAYTLAQRLRHEGRLSLDLLHRFGEHLISVANDLEQKGIAHRDIKPENIGVGETPSGALTLILFDFSLSTTPADNIRAGTPPYLDPFLHRRPNRRWDVYAEHFAVAMTLYEMGTGTLPTWGDGQSDAGTLDCEVTIDSELFDPTLRDHLTRFFAKALHSDYQQRFDHAEDMLRAWQRAFIALDQPAAETDHGLPDDWSQVLSEVSEETPLTALGLNARVLDALARMGAQTVGEVGRIPRRRLYRTQGLGQQTIKTVRNLAEQIDSTFPTPPLMPPPEPDDVPGAPEQPRLSVDRMASQLIPRRMEKTAQSQLMALLGLNGDAGHWPSLQGVAEQLSASVSVLRDILWQAQQRWGKHAWMTFLRTEIAAILDKHGGIVTADELTHAVLLSRGSSRRGEDRWRLAQAVAVAAVETELIREGARLGLYRGTAHIFVVSTPATGTYQAVPSQIWVSRCFGVSEPR
ncbi:BREX system serine/threonine kinase PglW, partial [Candidatus Entotheonella palauensis]|uniref:BREX system serine/threonine kinase PglW n=1 Tax=Candidatus Entotheonella palauensis TaxID=93172 RepID=UPI000B7E39C6